jgi:hypothetical protein
LRPGFFVWDKISLQIKPLLNRSRSELKDWREAAQRNASLAGAKALLLYWKKLGVSPASKWIMHA